MRTPGLITITWFYYLSATYQVDLYDGTNTVSGVVTQGSPTSNEWVSSFKVRVGVVECELRYIVDSDDAPVVSTYLFH